MTNKQTSRTNDRLDQVLKDGKTIDEICRPKDGRIGRRIYTDEQIFELEQERIFRRSWVFLAHSSEILEPGDYVTRELAGESVIVIRNDDGETRGFLNSCRHRGMRLCRAEQSNTAFMRCPYHGWSYNKDGELLTVFAENLYDAEDLKKDELGLIPITQLAEYGGFIFGSWSENVPPLSEFLGDMKFYIDMLVNRTPGKSHVYGVPQIWDVECNWKFATDNFTGDNFHVYTAHGYAQELGMLPPDPMALAGGHLIHSNDGNVLHMVPGPPIPEAAYFGLPEDLRPLLDESLNPAQLSLAQQHAFMVGTVFPNLSFLQVMLQADEASPPVPFLSMRFWQPTGPHSTRIWSFFMIEAEASDEYKRASYETYVRTFGPSGTFEQDDTENWEDCTRVNRGKIAQQYTLHHGMAVRLPADDNFAGPGTAWAGTYGERTQLIFYEEWKRWMTEANPWRK